MNLRPTKMSLQEKTYSIRDFDSFKGDDIFLVYGAFPTEVYNHRLDVNNSDGILVAHMAVSEKLITVLDKPNLPCRTYDSAKGKY